LDCRRLINHEVHKIKWSWPISKTQLRETEENFRIESDPYDIQTGHFKRYKPVRIAT